MASELDQYLAAEALPLFRTRADLHRWSAANAFGRQASEGLQLLQEAAELGDPAAVISPAQKAIASLCRILLRADDSSGVIGDVVRGLLKLHARSCTQAPPTPAKLVQWMIRFQFLDDQDFFELDPVDYADALGQRGLTKYRAELDKIAATVPPEPSEAQRKAAVETRLTDPGAWDSQYEHRRERFLLAHNAKRLAVVDRDENRIIELYARDRTRSYRLHEAAAALAEIGHIEQAIEWARRAAFLESGHQAEMAGHYWCSLLAEHGPAEELAARRMVFERWPTSSNATAVYRAAGDRWGVMEAAVVERLEQRPYDFIVFLLRTIKDVPRAWAEAHRTGLADDALWTQLVDAYQQLDPAAVIHVLQRLAESDLQVADVRNYKSAARRLMQMRGLAVKTGQADHVDAVIADIRYRHRNRPRLLQELDRSGC